MIKALRIVLFFAVLPVLLAVQVSAADWSEYGEMFNTDSVEKAVPDSAVELMEDVSISSNEDFGAALAKILRKGLSELKKTVQEPMKSAGFIITAAAICACAGTFYKAGNGIDALHLATALAVAVISAGDISACVGLGRSMITELSDFSKVLLPTLTATAAVSGAVTSAAAKYAAAALFMDILITCVENLLIPLIYAYMAAVIAECAIGGEGLSGAASLLKWIATSMLTCIVLAFVLYLSLSGVVSGSADAATVRIAKTAISTALPVVGSIVSDAASTVLLGASVIKSSVGAFGSLAVAAVCIAPVLKLACHYLLYKGAARLSDAIAGGSAAKVAGGIAGAFGMIMGAMGACAMMLFFSIISFVQAVG